MSDIMDVRTWDCIGTEWCYPVVESECISDSVTKVVWVVSDCVGSVVNDTDVTAAVILIFDSIPLLAVMTA